MQALCHELVRAAICLSLSAGLSVKELGIGTRDEDWELLGMFAFRGLVLI